jgi:hypothetical protein
MMVPPEADEKKLWLSRLVASERKEAAREIQPLIKTNHEVVRNIVQVVARVNYFEVFKSTRRN